MIPDRLPPNQAPGGIVAVIFDTNGNEVTRSIATPERVNDVDWMAVDAAEAVTHRGGGSMVAYDGDTGEKMVSGPMVTLDAQGVRQPATLDITDFHQLVDIVKTQYGGEWPWTIIGVFPLPDTPMPYAWWNNFCYTSGFTQGCELWVPCASIEGRNAGPNLVGDMLNLIACAAHQQWLLPGDTVRVPLGVAGRDDDEDVISYWWIGYPEINDHRRQVNMTSQPFVVPILWSSPLGWPEEEEG
jgi:hypothetical protein